MLLGIATLVIISAFMVQWQTSSLKAEREAVVKSQQTEVQHPVKQPLIKKKEISDSPFFTITKPPKPINILLIGVDHKTKGESFGRADSIMLATLKPETKEVLLLSIPRDTYIHIPDYGHNKLNRAYKIGGPPLIKQTLEAWLAVPIDDTITIDFEGFEKIIDLIGGIDVNVERDMLHGEFKLAKGLQTLSGKQALQYVRFRKSTDGNHDSDYTRMQRQQQVLQKLANELLKVRKFTESLAIIRTMFQSIDTTLSLGDIVTYGHYYSDIKSEFIRTDKFQGVGERRKGLWYEMISEKELLEKQTMLKNFLNVPQHSSKKHATMIEQNQNLGGLTE